MEDWREFERVTEENRPQTVAQQYTLARTELLPRMGKLSIRELTVPICEGVYRDMLTPRRPRNRNGLEYGKPPIMDANARNALVVMRKVLHRAMTLGLRTDNPAVPVTPVRRPAGEINALDADGMQQLRNAVRAYAARPKSGGPPIKYLSLVLDTMVGTSARIGEALAIRALEDIDLLSTPLVVHIRGTIVEYAGRGTFRQEMPKTSKSRRSIQVPMWLDAEIRAWLAQPENADNELLFQTRNATPVAPHNVRTNLRRIRRWADLPEWIVPHIMRKTAATAVTGAHGTDPGMWLTGHVDTRVLEGHYDKRGIVPYSVTSSLEAFSPEGAQSPSLPPQTVLASSVVEPVDPDVLARIEAARAEAHDVLAGMAAAMGTTVEQLPAQVRTGVQASILAKAF